MERSVVIVGKKTEMQIVMLSMSANKNRNGEKRCPCQQKNRNIERALVDVSGKENTYMIRVDDGFRENNSRMSSFVGDFEKEARKKNGRLLSAPGSSFIRFDRIGTAILSDKKIFSEFLSATLSDGREQESGCRGKNRSVGRGVDGVGGQNTINIFPVATGDCPPAPASGQPFGNSKKQATQINDRKILLINNK
jgi:hypothetical protein